MSLTKEQMNLYKQLIRDYNGLEMTCSLESFIKYKVSLAEKNLDNSWTSIERYNNLYAVYEYCQNDY